MPVDNDDLFKAVPANLVSGSLQQIPGYTFRQRKGAGPAFCRLNIFGFWNRFAANVVRSDNNLIRVYARTLVSRGADAASTKPESLRHVPGYGMPADCE